MAKYTELFSEYLENGGELPAIFQTIQGFETLFIGTYCDHEIGFETEPLFAIKLETVANEVIPIYKQRIDLIDNFIQRLNEPSKTKSVVHDLGQIDALSWVLPFNNNETDPSAKTRTEQSQNVDTETETGFSTSDVLSILDNLSSVVRNIKHELLNEFKHLFMLIY